MSYCHIYYSLIIGFVLLTGCKTKTESFEQIPSAKVLSKIDSVQTRHEIFGFGEAIAKTAQFGKFGKFQSYEVYEDVTTGKLITGVERFGPYRLYTHQGFDIDSNYTGPPRIEFLSKDGRIKSVVHPFDSLAIFNGNKPNLNPSPDRNPNFFQINSDEIPTSINTLLKNNLISDQKMNLSIEYDIQNTFLIVDSRYYIFEDDVSRSHGYEVMVFDSSGLVIGRESGFGQLNIVDLTSNGRYLYVNTGGATSPNTRLNYEFKIMDLVNHKTVFQRGEVTREKVSGFVISDTNLGVYHVKSLSGGSDSMREAYLIDHDNHKVYSLHKNKHCLPGSYIIYNKEYCECVDVNSNKTRLIYKKDFISETLK